MFDEDNRTLCSNGHKTIPIWVPDLKTEGRNNSKAYKCPFCNGKGTMSLIIDVFEGALETMEHCSCNDDPQKDGCYKCLYAYRQSQHIGEISRDSAIALLKAILSGKENRVEIKKLAQVDTNHLFDSELEREFVGAFEKLKIKCRAYC